MKENISTTQKYAHEYYVLNEIFKNKYISYLKSQENTDKLWHEMHEAHNKLLQFTNEHGKYPYSKDGIFY